MGQVGFGGITCLSVDPGGQVIEELLDDAYVFVSDLTTRLRLGDIGQPGRHRLTSYRLPRPQQLRVLDALSGFCHGDIELRGQHVSQVLAAECLGISLGGQSIDDRVVHHRLAPSNDLAAALEVQQFDIGQRAQIESRHLVVDGFPLVVEGKGLLLDPTRRSTSSLACLGYPSLRFASRNPQLPGQLAGPRLPAGGVARTDQPAEQCPVQGLPLFVQLVQPHQERLTL